MSELFCSTGCDCSVMGCEISSLTELQSVEDESADVNGMKGGSVDCELSIDVGLLGVSTLLRMWSTCLFHNERLSNYIM